MAMNVKRTGRMDPLKKIHVKKFPYICLVNRLSKKHLLFEHCFLWFGQYKIGLLFLL